MVYNKIMNDVQGRLTELNAKGWTNTAIADEAGVTVNAVEKWKAGDHNPGKATLLLLDNLLKRKRIPKKRRYTQGSRGQEGASDGE
jgi:transcriptional regulator with XRE-family HTH domain